MSHPSERQALKVEPLRRYRTPGYPTTEDFDPSILLAHPYPFSTRFRTWVTSFGASSLLCSWIGAEPPGADAPANPLTVAQSGLPYRSSPFGTGRPSYLSEDMARSVIEKVFQDAGYQLENDVKYEKGDVSFRTTAFDKDAKVGYVWGDWDSLDHADAVINWNTPRLDERSVQQLLELDKEDPEAATSHLQAIAAKTKALDKEKAHTDAIDAAMALESTRDRIDALSPILDKLLALEDDERISLREMNALEQDAEERDFIAVISQFDSRFIYNPWLEPLRKEREAAMAIEDAEERTTALNEVRKKQATKSLEALEEAVSDYLAWARSQGLQN